MFTAVEQVTVRSMHDCIVYLSRRFGETRELGDWIQYLHQRYHCRVYISTQRHSTHYQ